MNATERLSNEDFERAFKTRTLLEGRVLRPMKGGYVVLVGGHHAFLPQASQQERPRTEEDVQRRFQITVLMPTAAVAQGMLHVVREIRPVVAKTEAPQTVERVEKAEKVEKVEKVEPADKALNPPVRTMAHVVRPKAGVPSSRSVEAVPEKFRRETPAEECRPNRIIGSFFRSLLARSAATGVAEAHARGLLARLDVVLARLGVQPSAVELEELRLLVRELGGMGFTLSSTLSAYIRRNHLERRYPHIAGRVKFMYPNDGGREWTMDGGFSPKIYRVLCEALGLSGKQTSARATGFRSAAELAAS